ncbi:MAG: NAD(+) synthase [Firmicutes bacterium]|nr:NAD(+) synthase [Bacillota bacterium]
MNIAIAQMEVFPADLRKNKQTMLTLIDAARTAGAQVVMFPELAVSGLLVGDYWQRGSFIADCLQIGEELAAAAPDLTLIFGNIGLREGKLCNCVYMSVNGELGRLEAPLGGSYIPGAYEVFAADNQYQVYNLEIGGKICRTAFLLGDWRDAELPCTAADVDLLVNLSSAPYIVGSDFSQPYVEGRAFIQLNSIGLQAIEKRNYVFPGGSCFRSAKGDITASAPMFKERLLLADLWQSGEVVAPLTAAESLGGVLIYAAGAFCRQIGVEKAVIGVSGGIDSAVSACVYTAALGKDNVLLVNMPTEHNCKQTIALAKQLAKAIGAPCISMPLFDSLSQLRKQLAHVQLHGEAVKLSGTAWESVQSRERTRYLAALAAACGGIFTDNGNKAEAAVGYATFYGDLAGAFAVLGDLWKYQVYQAAEYLQSIFPDAPLQQIAALRPSAELSAEQSIDAGLGDPLTYAYHDHLLRSWVEQGSTPYDILRHYVDGDLAEYLGCDAEIIAELFPTAAELTADIERWWLQYRGLAVAKRLQAPPFLVLSACPLSQREEVQSAVYFCNDYLQLRKEAVGN